METYRISQPPEDPSALRRNFPGQRFRPFIVFSLSPLQCLAHHCFTITVSLSQFLAERYGLG